MSWILKKILRAVQKFFAATTDIAKWSIISVSIGLLVGFGTSGVLILLETAISYTKSNFQIYFPLYFLLPGAMGVSSFIIYKTLKEASGDGTEEIVCSAVSNDGKLKFFNFVIKQIATFLTLVFGGSAGKEALGGQIGAYLSLMLAKTIGLSVGHTERIVIIIAGVSAGFAVVFGAPIAAGFFALEALFAGKILYRVLVPAFISSFVAYWSMHILNVEYIYHPISLGSVPGFWEFLSLIKAIVAGLFFGVISYGVVVAMNFSNHF